MLPQRSDVSFPFTVEQIVRMGREPWRNTDREDADDDVYDWAIRVTDVSTLTRREFPLLSGGEQVWSALAWVLAQEPGLLLLDEPTASSTSPTRTGARRRPWSVPRSATVLWSSCTTSASLRPTPIVWS